MNFKRRHLIIKTMEDSEVVDYYYEFPRLSKTERNKKIKTTRKELASMENDINSKVILSVIENDTNKMIGAIYAERKDKIIEEITVSIPSESKLLRYGFEVIDQFIKICKEEWSDEIKFIKLDKRSDATEIYLREKSLESEYICIA